jgi:hypothetical protein
MIPAGREINTDGQLMPAGQEHVFNAENGGMNEKVMFSPGKPHPIDYFLSEVHSI